MSDSGFALHTVTAADCAQIAVLHEACFPDEPWTETSVSEILALDGAFGWSVRRGSQLCGFVLARGVLQECEILALAVATPWRRRGLGRSLLGAVIAHAPLIGAEIIHLEAAEDNPAATRLYGAAGFHAVGRRPDYYRRDNGRRAAAVLYSRKV